MISRLRLRDDFQALRRDGRAVRRDPLGLVYRPADDCSAGTRVAFAIGREVGTAVARNRVRRRLRSVMIELSALGDNLPVGDYLVRVTRGGAEFNSSELRENLVALVNELWQQPKNRG